MATPLFVVVVVSMAVLCNDHAYAMLCVLFISPEIIKVVVVAMVVVLSIAIVVFVAVSMAMAIEVAMALWLWLS